MRGVETEALNLLSTIYTTPELKQVSVALETLAQSKSFKTHARAIATDDDLTLPLKRKQLLELVQDIHVPKLYNFFVDMFSEGEFWLFSSRQFDYFDDFSQSFQLLTEKLTIVHLVTAIEVKETDMVRFSKDMGKAFGKQVVIHPQINPHIIGGAQIRMGNLIFDYTLKSKFTQFQRHWISKLERTTELVGRE